MHASPPNSWEFTNIVWKQLRSLIQLSLNVSFSKNSLITSSSLFPSFLLETSIARSHKGAGRSSLGVGACVILITAPGKVSLISERKHCLCSSVIHLCAKGLGSKDLFASLLILNFGLALDLTCSTMTTSCTLFGSTSLLLELFHEHALSVQDGSMNPCSPANSIL